MTSGYVCFMAHWVSSQIQQRFQGITVRAKHCGSHLGVSPPGVLAGMVLRGWHCLYKSDNGEEKLSQTPYMSRIFSMSTQTIGWTDLQKNGRLGRLSTPYAAGVID